MSKLQRYSSYKDSGVEWLGEIPEEWEVQKLKFIVKEHSGNGFPLTEQGDSEGNIPFFKVSDINGKELFIETSNNYVNEVTIKKMKWNIIPINSIVAAKIGEALRKNHRKITKVPSVIDNNCIAFEPIKIDSKFNYYLHKIIDFDWFSNAGAVPSISVSQYKNFKISLPSKPEQTAIAFFLDEKTAQIDQAISQKEKMIELLKERRQIVINEAVTKGINQNVPLKDSGVEWIGEIPEHWEVVRSKRLFQQRKERAKKNERQLTASQKYGVIYQDEFMEREGRKVTQVEYNHEILKRVEANDFLISMRSFQGGIEYCKYSGSVSSAYVALIPIKHVVSEYFKSLFKSQKYITALSSTSNLVRDGQALRFENFSMVDLLIIPENEQILIAKYIDEQTAKIDAAVELQQNYIAKLKEYKATLIDSVVTGKVRVV